MATDQSWMATRWYAPALGRFMSEDSLLGEMIDPATRHLYSYGSGDPAGRWDPDGRDDTSIGQGCYPGYVYKLNCGLDDFDQMSGLERKNWMRAVQNLYAPTWFNSIEAVLGGMHNNEAVKPGRGWFSKVDAYILAAIQDGLRLRFQKGALVRGNSTANELWRRFFIAHRNKQPPSKLRTLWGLAEQAATNYGVDHSKDRRATLRENAFKSITDVWRIGVAFGDAIKTVADTTVCRLYALCHPIPELTGVIRDGLVDPRAKASVAVVYHYAWHALGLVTCAYVTIRGVRQRLC